MRPLKLTTHFGEPNLSNAPLNIHSSVLLLMLACKNIVHKRQALASSGCAFGVFAMLLNILFSCCKFLFTASFTPMPAKYLYRTSQTVSVTSETVSENNQDDDDDEDSSDKTVDNLDTTEVNGADNEAECETVDLDLEIKQPEVKVRKLVIKSDGMNFVSSFKRKSLDHHTSVTEICETGEESDDDGDDNTNRSSSVPFSAVDSESVRQHRRTTGIDEDEDTNEYSNERFEDRDKEAEHAALAISSAEDSEDTQNESNYGNIDSNSEYATNIKHFGLPGDKENFSEMYSSSSFSGAGHDFMTAQSPLSNVAAGGSVGRFLGNDGLEDCDTMDKFDMYQPITECLTDSEENSFYSAETGTSRATGSDTGLPALRHKPLAMESISNEDSDQDVKAQMASAINSILSLSQGASGINPSVYSYSQSNHSFQKNNQSNSFNASSNFQPEQSDDSLEVTGVSENETDLDAAVNSILM